MKKTEIKSIDVKSFRSLKNVHFDLGSRITLVAGRNGTSKTTILGILAQICSFEKNYVPYDNESGYIEEELNYKTVYNEPFFSEFRSHFRISEKYDTPDNKYEVAFKICDAQEQLNISANLNGTKRGKSLRLVLRKNKSIISNTSRNITHPSIFLSLERLIPIGKRENNVVEINDLTDQEKDFLIKSNKRIFTSLDDHNSISSNIPKNSGISSTVVTTDKYDVNSASSGEDNIGQILMSLLSFRRLKEKWANYKGGLLLIDELDASLFPRAQIELFDFFDKIARELNLQIIFTTHSPTLISHAYEKWNQCQKNASTKNNIVINYLTDARGFIENKPDFTLSNIVADLNITGKTVEHRMKINCYYEDTEAYFMSKSLLKNEQKKLINHMNQIKLGSENYKQLIKVGVPEFKKSSLIVLDGDVRERDKKIKNLVYLPSTLPPEQLIYKYLSELDPVDPYWSNKHDFSKMVFKGHKTSKDIEEYTFFDENTQKYILKENSSQGKKCREIFKAWFNYHYENYFKKGGINPFIKWKKENSVLVQEFQQEFDKAYISVFGSTNYLV